MLSNKHRGAKISIWLQHIMTWRFKATANVNLWILDYIQRFLHFGTNSCGLIRISWLVPRHLIAIICHPRLVGVEMTYVSASFGEPIKDGLSCHCRTEGERKIAGAARGRRAKDRDRDFGSKKKRSSDNVFSYGGCKVEEKRGEHPVSLSVGTEPLRGHTNVSARKRLRCRDSKLAAHLGCRSHQLKMQTFYPNFSSGKTRFVFLVPF